MSAVEVLKHICVYHDSPEGWVGELNIASWYGNDPVYDIREWRADRGEYVAGISLTREEMDNLAKGYMRFRKNTRTLSQALCVDNSPNRCSFVIEGNSGSYQIASMLAVLSPTTIEDATKMLTVVVWDRCSPKFDIRAWYPHYTRFTSGVKMDDQEMEKLVRGYVAWRAL